MVGYQPRQGYNQGYRQQNQRQRTPGYDPNAKYSLKKRIEYREDHIDPTLPVRLNKFLLTQEYALAVKLMSTYKQEV